MKSQMLRIKSITITIIVIIVSIANSIAQDIPHKISYQGKLLENGNPFTGTKTIIFTIGTWTETHPNVTITDGLYSVSLGGYDTPIPPGIFDNSPTATLTIEIDGSALSPVTDIVSVGYAFKSLYADIAHNTENIGGQPVSGLTPGMDEVLKWNGSEWEPGLDEVGNGDNDWIFNGNDIYSGNSGNVGIGTINPVDKFSVVGNISTNGQYNINGSRVLANNNNHSIFLGINAGINNLGSDNTIVGDNSGPINNGNNNTFVGRQAGNNNQAGSGNVFLGYQSGYSELGSNKLYIANSPGVPLIYGDFFNALVGISTNNPNERLTINGVISLQEISSAPNNTNGYGKLYTKPDSKLYFKDSYGNETDLITKIQGSGSFGKVAYWSGNLSLSHDTYFFWDAGNNRLGVNDASPEYTLDVGGDINFSGELLHNGNTYGGSSTWTESGSDIYRLSGNVGIGTDNPTRKLDVVGSLRVSPTASGYQMSIDYLASEPTVRPLTTEWGVLGTSGYKWYEINVLYSKSFSYSGPSIKSYLVKSEGKNWDIIEPISNALKKIESIEGIVRTIENNKMQSNRTPQNTFLNDNEFGFNIKDIEKVLPELVAVDNESGQKSVAYMALIPVLVEAIKEQQQQIEDLKTEMSELKSIGNNQ